MIIQTIMYSFNLMAKKNEVVSNLWEWHWSIISIYFYWNFYWNLVAYYINKLIIQEEVLKNVGIITINGIRSLNELFDRVVYASKYPFNRRVDITSRGIKLAAFFFNKVLLRKVLLFSRMPIYSATNSIIHTRYKTMERFWRVRFFKNFPNKFKDKHIKLHFARKNTYLNELWSSFSSHLKKWIYCILDFHAQLVYFFADIKLHIYKSQCTSIIDETRFKMNFSTYPKEMYLFGFCLSEPRIFFLKYKISHKYWV